MKVSMVWIHFPTGTEHHDESKQVVISVHRDIKHNDSKQVVISIQEHRDINITSHIYLLEREFIPVLEVVVDVGLVNRS